MLRKVVCQMGRCPLWIPPQQTGAMPLAGSIAPFVVSSPFRGLRVVPCKLYFKYFENKYNILAVDIIGHGKSTDTKKGDSLEKMSAWIYDIMNVEKIKKIHIVGISLGAVLAQDFANRYPEAVNSLACFGGYDINNFDEKMQKENSTSQIRMILKALVSIKWFAKANKKISAFSPQAQNDFYDMNIQFPKKSFLYLASLDSMVNVFQTKSRKYPLLIGCGKFDIPMELKAVEDWKSRV